MKRGRLWIELFRGLGIGSLLLIAANGFGLFHTPPEAWAADIVFVAIWLHSEVLRLD